MPQIFPIDRILFSWVPRVKTNPALLVRLLNTGIFLFYPFFLTFCISFTLSNNRQRKLTAFILFLPMLSGILLLDPLIVRLMIPLLQSRYPNLSTVEIYQPILNFFRILEPLYLIAGTYILIRYTLERPRLRKLRRYLILIIASVLSLAFMFFVTFSWHPELLTVPTLVPNFIRYAAVDISSRILLINLLPFMQIAVFSFLVFITVRFRQYTSYEAQTGNHIQRSISIAALGSKVVTHSLKNYIFSIRAETDNLSHYNKNFNTESKASIDRIIELCNMAEKYTERSFRMLNRIELDLHPVKLSKIVENEISLFTKSNSVTIQLLRLTPIDPVVYLDENHFREVLRNLINNAIEAVTSLNTERNPELIIEIGSDKRWAEILIEDNGPGVQVEEISSLFSPFYTTKNPNYNWGIGLTYCHRIVHAHEGRIELGNRSSGGMMVRISLPLV